MEGVDVGENVEKNDIGAFHHIFTYTFTDTPCPIPYRGVISLSLETKYGSDTYALYAQKKV
jgi:hypothetical protein